LRPPVGKGTKVAYIGLTGINNGPSNFIAEFFLAVNLNAITIALKHKF
jgi:hypothetical protein